MVMITIMFIMFVALVFAFELADVKKEKERRFGMKSNRYR
tara:strand:+ start:408 stop:527 length:120 start_codon:yes stop_codon:yes gene_type:complete